LRKRSAKRTRAIVTKNMPTTVTGVQRPRRSAFMRAANRCSFTVMQSAARHAPDTAIRNNMFAHVLGGGERRARSPAYAAAAALSASCVGFTNSTAKVAAGSANQAVCPSVITTHEDQTELRTRHEPEHVAAHTWINVWVIAQDGPTWTVQTGSVGVPRLCPRG